MSNEFMEKKLKNKEQEDRVPESKVLKTLRKSRKAYLIEYLCGFSLLGLVGYSYLQGINLTPLTKYFLLGAGLSITSVGEIARLFHRYKITNSKLIIIKGIIKQRKKNVNYHPLAFVPDISMKQGRIQRLLNFGTVFVEAGASSFEIKDIDRPRQVMELVESLIEKTRKGE